MLLLRFSSSIMGLKQTCGQRVSYCTYCLVVYHHFGQVYLNANTLFDFLSIVCLITECFVLLESRDPTGYIWCSIEGTYRFWLRSLASNIWQWKRSDQKDAVFSAFRTVDCSSSVMYVHHFLYCIYYKQGSSIHQKNCYFSFLESLTCYGYQWMLF